MLRLVKREGSGTNPLSHPHLPSPVHSQHLAFSLVVGHDLSLQRLPRVCVWGKLTVSGWLPRCHQIRKDMPTAVTHHVLRIGSPISDPSPTLSLGAGPAPLPCILPSHDLFGKEGHHPHWLHCCLAWGNKVKF